MMKILIFLIAIAGIGTGVAIGDGIDPGNLVRYLGKFGGYDEKSNTEHRPGIDVDEMNLQSIDPTLITAALADKMNDSRVGGGLYNGNWVSFTNMFTVLGISTQAAKDKFQKWFVIDSKDDPEEYWGDINHDNTVATNEWFHRFNLLRSNWDTMTISDLFAAPVAYTDTPATHDGGGLRWLANFGKDASGADDQTLKGNFATVADRRNQIAANLLDYCDSNSTPTTDYSEAAGVATVTYMGNERTPRINEVNIGIRAVCTRLTNASKYKANLVIYSSVGGELINIYGDTFNPATLTVSYSVTATVTCNNAGYAAFGTKTYNLAAANNTTSINIGGAGYAYAATEYSIYTGVNTTYVAAVPTVSITNVSVTITSAKLTYGGVVVDCVKWPSTTTIATLKAATAPPAGGWEQRAYFGCLQADDPRQHLFASEWSTGTTDSGAGAYAYGGGGVAKGTPGVANNSTVAPIAVTMSTSLKDLEVGNDPSYNFGGSAPRLSTAYIRNGPMVSPWELGCIHRGVKWETINLKEYNAAAGSNPSTGGGLYTASPAASKNGGDANILDQIKMTAKVKSKQKVNLTLKTDDTSAATSCGVLSALFKKIHVGSSYASMLRLVNASNKVDFPGSAIGERWLDRTGAETMYTWNGSAWSSTPIFTGDGYVKDGSGKINIWDGASWNSPWADTGTEIADTDVKAIVNDIMPNSKNYKTRAFVATAPSLYNRSGQTNDRTKEEIIGKMINLTTLAPTGYFTIIILAQSIKDVGPGTFYKDLDMNGTISTASETTFDIDGDGALTSTGISETIIKSGFGKYKQYADEIMAEQKIRADVYRDPSTGKCTIIKMEYVED